MNRYSYRRLSGQNSVSTYAVGIPGGPALRNAHLKVYVGSTPVLQTEGTHYLVSSNRDNVTFQSGHVPSANTPILFVRDTPDTADTRLVDFTPGAPLKAQDLDESALSILYASQEAADRGVFLYDPVANQVTVNPESGSAPIDLGDRVMSGVELDFGTI